ncbi:MAG TPA: FAD-binding oxidoreductase [Gemmataceae bacterium]|jgi:glycolate oxidase FAD binding subunit
MSDPLTIDGVGPMPVERPASAAELAEIVRRCAADQTAVYPVGGGTMLDYGLPPARPGVAVDLRALDQVIDFPARDMTITVGAGITIAKLNEITRAEGLHLPIDVPDADRATLGGAIACNVSGPRRYGYGTFRDYVLGITTVNDRGELVSAGGRVVKNVAGYDLMKLHTGALGTLGVIAQVTLRLRPVAEERAILAGSNGDIARLGPVLDRLSQTQTRPTVVDFGWNPGVKADGHPKPTRAGFALFLGFDGGREAVAWQAEQIQRELAEYELDFTITPADRVDAQLARAANPPDAPLRFRVSLPPSKIAPFCEQVSDLPIIDLRGQAGSGVVRGYFADSVRLADTQRHVPWLVEIAAGQSGNIVIERCPPEWKKSLPVWGRPPADLALQKAVKRALDPQNIFNPGRFVTDAF